ncbi:hypothetical protein YPPY54_0911, partial [Yersinia pestis PY-54]
MSFSYPLP